MATTFRNNRTNETVSTELTKAQLIQQFAETAGDDHWLWYWMAKQVQETAKAPACKDMIAFLADSFLLAIGMGLKRPMIRLHYKGRRYKVYLSRKGTLCIKTGALIPGTNDPTGDEEYMGCLYNGRFLVNRERKLLPGDQEVLDGLSADPAGFLAKASKDMCRCCYCGKPLEDQRSKDVGYGATCAVHWGLPWGKTYDEKVPSFAQMWGNACPTDRNSIRGMCCAIRHDPYDQLAWDALGDALEEAGYQKRPSMPDRAVTLPAGGEGMPTAPKQAPTPVVKKDYDVDLKDTLYHKEGNYFSIDASDLAWKNDDPMKVLRVKGKESTQAFRCMATHHNNDNEITHWTFKNLAGTATLIVFND